jgi:hypothetical protein
VEDNNTFSVVGHASRCTGVDGEAEIRRSQKMVSYESSEDPHRQDGVVVFTVDYERDMGLKRISSEEVAESAAGELRPPYYRGYHRAQRLPRSSITCTVS